jgi:hypothetical protein
MLLCNERVTISRICELSKETTVQPTLIKYFPKLTKEAKDIYNYLAIIIKQQMEILISDNEEQKNILHNLPQNIIDNEIINVKLFNSDKGEKTGEKIGEKEKIGEIENILIHKVDHRNIINTYNTYCQYLSNKTNLIEELKNKK